MTLKKWYIAFLASWALIAFPGFILGLAYAGGDLSSMLPYPNIHWIDFTVWLLNLLWLLSPFFLAPLGISRRDRK